MVSPDAALCRPVPKKPVGRPRKYPNDEDAQLARKREVDRRAQRSSRQRTKNRMTNLEKKVELLQTDDAQNNILGLVKTIEGLRQENEKLRNFAEKIRGLTNEIENVSHDSSILSPFSS